MATPPKSGYSQGTPPAPPVARWQGRTAQPPQVIPTPGPFARMKAGLPKMPPVFELFHKPRTPGNGDGRL